MKLLIFATAILLISCERPQHNQFPGSYRGEFSIESKSIQQTIDYKRTILPDMVIKWADAPHVRVQAYTDGTSYSFSNCIVRADPDCIDSSFMTFSGSGYLVGDSLFETGIVRYERYFIGIKITDELGTWRTRMKRVAENY
jgi:hypothetical protein